jgi:trehalose/maltose hydrolase-like predicted phosphorylase
MSDMHLAALELALTAENWSAKVAVRSAVDGRVVNAGAKLYRRFNNKHLEPLTGEVVGEDGVYMLVPHLSVECSCRAGGANPSVRER